MEFKKGICNDERCDYEQLESIYDDYLKQPQGDLDDYIFGTETEHKKTLGKVKKKGGYKSAFYFSF